MIWGYPYFRTPPFKFDLKANVGNEKNIPGLSGRWKKDRVTCFGSTAELLRRIRCNT